MFDLPNHSVIVGGLEYWTKGDEVLEPRLVAKLKELVCHEDEESASEQSRWTMDDR